jgi:hypothetical protein
LKKKETGNQASAHPEICMKKSRPKKKETRESGVCPLLNFCEIKRLKKSKWEGESGIFSILNFYEKNQD